jgi:hypothetical protein
VNTTPTLLLRIRRPGGQWTYANPAYSGNNRLKALHAVVACANGTDKHEHHPEGVYYIRFTAQGKRHFERVGCNPDDAKAALARQEYLLKGLAVGVQSPESPASAPNTTENSTRKRWDDAFQTS